MISENKKEIIQSDDEEGVISKVLDKSENANQKKYMNTE